MGTYNRIRTEISCPRCRGPVIASPVVGLRDQIEAARSDLLLRNPTDDAARRAARMPDAVTNHAPCPGLTPRRIVPGAPV